MEKLVRDKIPEIIEAEGKKIAENKRAERGSFAKRIIMEI